MKRALSSAQLTLHSIYMNMKWTTTGVLLGVTLVVFAEPEPPEVWTNKTARKILTSSPWTKIVKTRPDDQRGQAPLRLTIRWESALPVVQAHQKLGTDPPALEDRDYYVVAVIGPLGQQQIAESESKMKAFLTPTGKTALAAVKCRALSRRDGDDVLLFLFPRTLDLGKPRRFRLPFGLTSNTWELEFSAELGPLSVKQTFPLEDMIYRGRLEL